MTARSGTRTGGGKRFAGLLAFLCALPAMARAERLPATIYTTGQGLASNDVFRIVPDSRGFIWFATFEGLSRFDGYGFKNYGVDDGLPSSIINDFLETREGVYLVATAAGLARLETTAARRAAPAPLFTVHSIASDPASRHVLALYQDRKGQVWVGTRAGLFALDNAGGDMRFRPIALGGTA